MEVKTPVLGDTIIEPTFGEELITERDDSQNSGCKKFGTNFGIFKTSQECAKVAHEQGCDTISIPVYTPWEGCKCCLESGGKPNAALFTYKIKL